ncbi:MAG: hypothetical protein PHY44_01715 [Lachnospiraceae bacterium]|nr:hypothetical protein [Lachnospiraceae bacterium]
MDNDIKTLLTDIAELFDTKLQPINEQLNNIDGRLTKIETCLESDIKPNIQMLYTSFTYPFKGEH